MRFLWKGVDITRVAPWAKGVFFSRKNTGLESTNVQDAIVEVNDKLIDKATDKSFKFGIDSNGNYGYYKDGADTVTPFSYPNAFMANLNFVRADRSDKTVSVAGCEVGKLYLVTTFAQNWLRDSAVYPSNLRLGGCKILKTFYNAQAIGATSGDTWLGVRCDIVESTSTTISATAYTPNYGSVYITAVKFN